MPGILFGGSDDMGYTTRFAGEIHFDHPVSAELKKYINSFAKTRHVRCDTSMIQRLFPEWQKYSWKGQLGFEGEYFIGPRIEINRPVIDSEETFYRWKDEINKANGIIDDNVPPRGVPGLWCNWIIDENGSLCWSRGEKFYNYEEWLVYLIDRFFAPKGYLLDGKLLYSGEREDDMGYIFVRNNVVRKVNAWDFADFNEASFIGEIERSKQ